MARFFSHAFSDPILQPAKQVEPLLGTQMIDYEDSGPGFGHANGLFKNLGRAIEIDMVKSL